jgi:hypothetical protein
MSWQYSQRHALQGCPKSVKREAFRQKIVVVRDGTKNDQSSH